MPVLFSYGTLRDPAVQLSTFGREVRHFDDGVAGYTLGRAGPHANIVWTGNLHGVVEGVALEVTDSELEAADTYERAFGYERIDVVLVSGGKAWAYVSRSS